MAKMIEMNSPAYRRSAREKKRFAKQRLFVRVTYSSLHYCQERRSHTASEHCSLVRSVLCNCWISDHLHISLRAFYSELRIGSRNGNLVRYPDECHRVCWHLNQCLNGNDSFSSFVGTYTDFYRPDSSLVLHTRRVRSRCIRVYPHRTVFFPDSSAVSVCLFRIDSSRCTRLDQEWRRFLSVDIRRLMPLRHWCPCCCPMTRPTPDSIRIAPHRCRTSCVTLSYLVQWKERRSVRMERMSAWSKRKSSCLQWSCWWNNLVSSARNWLVRPMNRSWSLHPMQCLVDIQRPRRSHASIDSIEYSILDRCETKHARGRRGEEEDPYAKNPSRPAQSRSGEELAGDRCRRRTGRKVQSIGEEVHREEITLVQASVHARRREECGENSHDLGCLRLRCSLRRAFSCRSSAFDFSSFCFSFYSQEQRVAPRPPPPHHRHCLRQPLALHPLLPPLWAWSSPPANNRRYLTSCIGSRGDPTPCHWHIRILPMSHGCIASRRGRTPDRNTSRRLSLNSRIQRVFVREDNQQESEWQSHN